MHYLKRMAALAMVGAALGGAALLTNVAVGDAAPTPAGNADLGATTFQPLTAGVAAPLVPGFACAVKAFTPSANGHGSHSIQSTAQNQCTAGPVISQSLSACLQDDSGPGGAWRNKDCESTSKAGLGTIGLHLLGFCDGTRAYRTTASAVSNVGGIFYGAQNTSPAKLLRCT